MASIILDVGEYHSRTNLIPPKRGKVKASFTAGDKTLHFTDCTFEEAVNEAKHFCRDFGIQRLTLLDVTKL